MSLVSKDKGGGDFKVVPAGTHVAICVMIVDLGIQGGGKFKPSQKVYIRWEFPNEVIRWKDAEGFEHEGPMIIGKEYTNSLSLKANLRADLEAWRGKTFTEQELKGFDLTAILGKPCMLGITHNKTPEKTYANISAVMGLTRGMPIPKQHNPSVTYTPDEHDQKAFESLPEWLQKKIDGRVKDGNSPTVDHQGKYPDEEFNDDIPF